ncbi:hypothetical protein E1263_25215 [Kribbella antibiotica]|uniref:Uncharacterized protein n=1 Tax=Kribbella antibiotica TaxID=190195 RepID=A0A4R4ZD48_9ACTN|nr:hypothetical protein [Kribbella antibiotica]TDD56343.1 hypothetical protein E1263_25215 [Kribbella antibiotica]
MSLDELRRHLNDQATEIDLATPAPLAQVQRRARQVRRRRALTGVVTAAACLAVGTTLLTGTPLLDRSEPAKTPTPIQPVRPKPVSDGMPSAPVDPAKGDYVKDGLRYQAVVAGAELQEARIGNGPLSFTWTPTDTQVDFRIFCTLPGNRSAGDVAAVVLRLNKKVISSQACGEVSDPLPGERFGAILHQSLRVGRPLQLTATVVDGNNRPVEAPGLTVGAAVYTIAETTSLGAFGYIELPTFAQLHGRLYRLDDSTAIETTTDALDTGVSADGPAFEPYFVVAGINGGGLSHSLELAGTPGGRSYQFNPADGPGSGFYFAPVRPQAAGPVYFRQTGRLVVSGELFLGIYIPAE